MTRSSCLRLSNFPHDRILNTAMHGLCVFVPSDIVIAYPVTLLPQSPFLLRITSLKWCIVELILLAAPAMLYISGWYVLALWVFYTSHLYMMTSSNVSIFRVTGHLCGEFTGHRWSPGTKASDVELWYFFDLRLNEGWENNREAGDL